MTRNPRTNLHKKSVGNSQPRSKRRTPRASSLTFETLEARNLLATFIVNSAIDDATGAVDGLISLREATIAANTNAAFGDAVAGDANGDVIRFDAALAGSTYALTAGEIAITDDVQIQGGQSGLTIDAQSNSRIFNIDSTETVSIGRLNLVAGEAETGGAIFAGGTGTTTVSGVNFMGNVATGIGGGAVYLEVGSFYSTDSTFDMNIANGTSGSGGALFQSSGNVGVFNGSMTANEANRAGGAIEIVDGTFYSGNLQVGGEGVGNVAGPEGTAAPGNGGGMHVTGNANIIITGGSYTENIAAREGGGLWNQAGSTMFVFGTSITDNVATGAAADDGGGGIFNNGGDLFVSGSTISGNTATGTSGSGGGIFSTAGVVQVTSSTLTANVANRAGGGVEVIAGNFTLRNSSLGGENAEAGNVAGPDGSATPGNGGGLHVTGAANVFVSNTMVGSNVAASEGGGLWNQAGAFMRTDSGTTIVDNIAHGAEADTGGGGIFNNGGRLSVIDTTISGNIADGASGSGGGILSTDGNVFVASSVLEANVANRAGGGIELIDGRLDFNDSTLGGDDTAQGNIAGPEGSAAPGNGGGFHVSGTASSAYFRRSHVANNIAASEGGGLWNQSGSLLRVDNGTVVTANTAQGDSADTGGGGLFNNGGRLTVVGADITNNLANGDSGSGGGLLSTDGVVLVFDSLFDGNAAARAGGAIEVIDGFTRLAGTTVSNNNAGVTVAAAPGSGGGMHVTGNDSTFILVDSTFIGNVAQNQGGALWNQTDSQLLLQGNNRIESNSAILGVGGGVYNRGFFRAVDSIFESNSSGENGGGIFVTSTGEGDVRGSELTGNTATLGAGIFNGGALSALDSVFTDNVAANDGGAIFTDPTTTTNESGNTFSGNLPNDQN